MVDQRRVVKLNEAGQRAGAVIYWMSRDQRSEDNWALLFAQELALEFKSPLAVAFCLVPDYLGATIRQYAFMLKGLREVEERLSAKGIPFYLLPGTPVDQLPQLLADSEAGALVTDFSPLRDKRVWNLRIAEKLAIPFYEVDAHNIVPCRFASAKQEYGAYTFRPKLRRLLPEFFTGFPTLLHHPFPWPTKKTGIDWERVRREFAVDCSLSEVDWLKPGETAARNVLRDFLECRLSGYAELRNDPTRDGQSNLSPYLRFGQLAPQRAALETERYGEHIPSQEAFLEELVVRRELSDNFCYYNNRYDSFLGFPPWARASLDEHRDDLRPYLYSREQFEQALTHDILWNAAQREMLVTGKMHGYLRMYWAKKILEWSDSPERALDIAIYLNDRYELDGRDPNGYTGIAWSIGGAHDRPWGDRPVFGKIRYMSFAGCLKKFPVMDYVAKYRNE